MKNSSSRAERFPKNLIRPLPYRIAKASGSEDLLPRSPVHAGARDEVDYGGGASSERWQNPRLILGVCGGSRARVYIGGGETLGNVGHAHIARPSWLQLASCDASVKDSVKCSVFPMQQKDKLGSEVQFRKPWRARVEMSEEEERACGTSLLTHLPSGATPHLICWSTSLLTSHMGLNLAPTSCFCAANKLGCMSHGLTHMGFEISRNF
jgi:hypothetical protein